MKKILIHGSGQKASGWNEMISYLAEREEYLNPDLFRILAGKEATYENLYAAFSGYCGSVSEKFHLCGISLGGILALNYALDVPERVESLVLIGTPYKIPRAAFAFQNLIFRFLPEAVFETMAFGKKDTFVLGNSMKYLDFGGRLRELRCPVLIICGEKDWANRKAAGYLYENIRNARLNIVKDTGHVVNEEKPEKLAKILEGYYSAMV